MLRMKEYAVDPTSSKFKKRQKVWYRISSEMNCTIQTSSPRIVEIKMKRNKEERKLLLKGRMRRTLI